MTVGQLKAFLANQPEITDDFMVVTYNLEDRPWVHGDLELCRFTPTYPFDASEGEILGITDKAWDHTVHTANAIVIT